MSETLYQRNGNPAPQGRTIHTNGAKRYFVRDRKCSRCGGLGGGEQWAHTGWTCYQCGGSGHGGTERVPVYTAERLATLNVVAAKRDAKRRAAAEARAAAERAEADAKRAGFEAQHADVLPWLRAQVQQQAERQGYEVDQLDGFLPDMLRKGERFCEWSEAQAAAVRASMERQQAEDVKRAASRHLGAVNDRLSLNVTVERVFETYVTNHYGQSEPFFIVSMRTEDGNTVVSKSGTFHPEKGQSLAIKGTVKAHDSYRGEAQTILSRVTDVAADAQRRAKRKAEKEMVALHQLQESVQREMTGGIFIKSDHIKQDPRALVVSQWRRDYHGTAYAGILIERQDGWACYRYGCWKRFNLWDATWDELLAEGEPVASGVSYAEACAALLVALSAE